VLTPEDCVEFSAGVDEARVVEDLVVIRGLAWHGGVGLAVVNEAHLLSFAAEYGPKGRWLCL
jgi:hypothetical protein